MSIAAITLWLTSFAFAAILALRLRDGCAFIVSAVLVSLAAFSLFEQRYLTAAVGSLLALAALLALSQLSRRRTRAESGLKQTELQFKTLVENMPDGFRISQNGRTIYANRRFCELLGYDPEEVLGESSDLIYGLQQDLDVIQRQRRLRLEGKSSSYEARLSTKDGRIVPVIVSSQPVLDDDGNVIASCGVFTDITEREEIERDLRESEHRFRDYAEAATDRFWEIDENLRFTYLTPTTSNSAMPFMPNLVGTLWTELVSEQTIGRDRWRAHSESLAHRRAFRDLNFPFRRNHTRTVHWKLSGRPVFDEEGQFRGYRGTATEVTAEVEALQRATNAQSVLMSALNSISEGFAIFDHNDRLVLYNKRYSQIFPEVAEILYPGVRFEEILRFGVRAGMYELKEYDNEEQFIRERIEHHDNPQYPRIQQLGGNRWVQIIERKMPDGGWVGVWTDVTELKRREQELLQAQKMEAVGQLTGGIAHDFNNLLAVIQGNLELLRELLGEQEQLQKLVSRALIGAERGAVLTQRLLTFSRKQLLHPRAVDLQELIAGMTDLLKGSLGEAIEIETSFAESLSKASVDPNQLETALLNLALNARDAMPRGGRLKIECYEEGSGIGRAGGLNGTGRRDAERQYVTISVIDSGIGMKEEVKNRIFEPFFTTKDVGRGSGLGLSMVYGFIKQSGGQIELESSEGKGTIIRLSLPVAEPDALRTVEAPVTRLEARASGEVVLVVEDDEDVRILTCAILENLGYSVYEAGEAKAALEILEGGAEIDLLLADVVLPGGISGPELAEHARGIQPGVKVLFFSGYTEHSLVTPPPPGVPLLNKPFRKADLARMVREQLLGKSAAAESPLKAQAG